MKNGQKQQLSDLPKIVKHAQDDPHKSSQTDPSQDCYSRSLKLWIKWINFTWQPHASRDGEKRNPKGKKIRNFIIWSFLLPMKFGDIPAFLLEKNFKEKGRVNHESKGKTHRLFIWFFLTSLMTAQLDESLKPFEGWKIPQNSERDSQGSVRSCDPLVFRAPGSAGVSQETEVQKMAVPSFPTLRTNGSKLLTLKRKTWNTAYCTSGRVFMRLQKPLKSASNWKYILLLPRKLLHLWYFLVE